MYRGFISILISILGIIYIIYANFFVYHSVIESSKNYPSDIPSLIFNPSIFRITSLALGLLSLYLGLMGLKKNKTISYLGIFLSILLILLSFLPITELLIEDPAYNINIK